MMTDFDEIGQLQVKDMKKPMYQDMSKWKWLSGFGMRCDFCDLICTLPAMERRKLPYGCWRFYLASDPSHLTFCCSPCFLKFSKSVSLFRTKRNRNRVLYLK